MMGLAVFGGIAIVLTLASFVWPRHEMATCTRTHALTVSVGTPDPHHGGKTIAIRAKELLSAFPDWKVHDDPRVAATEIWLGVLCRFTVETHPPDSGIAFDHKGVTVTQCVP